MIKILARQDPINRHILVETAIHRVFCLTQQHWEPGILKPTELG
ncbi:MAG: hypothetical protein V7K67_33550 [Nostoc sp.]